MTTPRVQARVLAKSASGGRAASGAGIGVDMNFLYKAREKN
ncbi:MULTISPECIES: hypothetical protein [unclassified Rhodococcus (in: high G+C Gram-positive bacteria)]|nr:MULTISPECIES: hypothetical protein [unclassified Rhodococcus (in: high G+C Gram-positive bacteria)]